MTTILLSGGDFGGDEVELDEIKVGDQLTRDSVTHTFTYEVRKVGRGEYQAVCVLVTELD